MDENQLFDPPGHDTQNPDDPLTPEETKFIEAAYIGRAEAEYTILGNQVSMHTLNVRETLHAARLAAEDDHTYAKSAAVRAGIVALAIDTINGEPFHRAISRDENTARARYNRLIDNYYIEFIAECYKHYARLEKEQDDIIAELKKAGS